VKFDIFHYLRFMGNVDTVECNILVEGQFARVQLLRTRDDSGVQTAKRDWLKTKCLAGYLLGGPYKPRIVAVGSDTQGGVQAACATEPWSYN